MGIFKALRFFVKISFVIGIFSLASTVLILYQKGYTVLSVQTGSMTPTFTKGDAVIVHKQNALELQAGDIVSYRSSGDSKVIVSHRLVSIDYVTGKLVTKGDNLDLQDLPFPAFKVVGKVESVVPHLGAFLDFLHEPLGLAIIIYVPALFVILSEAKRLVRDVRQWHYRLYGQSA